MATANEILNPENEKKRQGGIVQDNNGVKTEQVETPKVVTPPATTPVATPTAAGANTGAGATGTATGTNTAGTVTTGTTATGTTNGNADNSFRVEMPKFQPNVKTSKELLDESLKRAVEKNPTPVEPAPVTTATTDENETPARMSYVDMLRKYGNYTREQKALAEKRAKSGRVLAGLFDGLSALGNLYYTTKGAPPQPLEPTLSKVEQARLDKAKAEIDAEAGQILNNYWRGRQLEDAWQQHQATLAAQRAAAALAQSNWERKFEADVDSDTEKLAETIRHHYAQEGVAITRAEAYAEAQRLKGLGRRKKSSSGSGGGSSKSSKDFTQEQVTDYDEDGRKRVVTTKTYGTPSGKNNGGGGDSKKVKKKSTGINNWK